MDRNSSRIRRLVVFVFVNLLLFSMYFLNATDASAFKVSGTRNKGLPAKYLIHTHDKTVEMDKCLALCIDNCHCLSYEMTGQLCELYNSSKLLKGGEMMKKPGSTSFVIEKQKNVMHCGVNDNLKAVGCCSKSNPCYNNGTCVSADPDKNGRRYKCLCKPHTSGVNCKTVTCGFYLGKEGDGLQYIDLPSGKMLTCYFDITNGIAWTLAMSCERSVCNNAKPLSKNKPVEMKKHDFRDNRLSLSRMKKIQEASKKWLVTCNFVNHGDMSLVREYIMGNKSQLDILSEQSTKCTSVEKFAILGMKCSSNTDSQCQIQATQENGKMLYFSLNSACTAASTTSGKQYFGVYVREDDNHECSKQPAATTEIWFGG